MAVALFFFETFDDFDAKIFAKPSEPGQSFFSGSDFAELHASIESLGHMSGQLRAGCWGEFLWRVAKMTVYHSTFITFTLVYVLVIYIYMFIYAIICRSILNSIWFVPVRS